MVRELAAGRTFDHPALDAVSWWRRDERVLHPEVLKDRPSTDRRGAHLITSAAATSARPLLITGASGTLGHAFTLLSHERGLHCVARTRAELDVSNRDQVRRELDELRPWGVVNAAGWVRVDHAEFDVDGCMRANALGSHVLAEECASRGIQFVTFSSDLVFNGRESRPYVESDVPRPLNVYGLSKFESERRVLGSMPDALVIRTSAFFGDWDDWNFVSHSLATLHAGGTVQAPDDAVVSPTYVSDLVHVALDLLIDGERGVWHLANVGALSWVELARTAARRAKLDASRIVRCAGIDIGWTAPRPAFSVLGSERASLLPDLEDAIARYVKSRAWERVSKTLRFGGSSGAGSRAAAFLQATT
jgi:dTDP-4-dehydrorhamnose reductase